MDRLLLLKTLNDHGLLLELKAEELNIFLLMVANSSKNAEGKLIIDQIRRVFGQDFSKEKLLAIAGALEKKGFIRLTSFSGRDGRFPDIALNYRIILPRTEEY